MVFSLQCNATWYLIVYHRCCVQATVLGEETEMFFPCYGILYTHFPYHLFKALNLLESSSNSSIWQWQSAFLQTAEFCISSPCIVNLLHNM
jgi:hypothetical protein